MSQNKKSCNSRRHIRETVQTAAGRPNHSKDGRLQFRVSEDGQPQFTVSDDDLPQFLVSAKASLKAGRVDQAIGILNDGNVEIVRKMLKRNPFRTDVMLILAMMFRQTGQFSKAKEWYKRVLEHEPHALVYNELKRLCLETRSLSEATEYQKKALQADPGNAEYMKALGILLISVGKTQEGIEMSLKSVEKAPDNADSHSHYLANLNYLPQLDPQMLFDEHTKWGGLHTPLSRAKNSHDNSPEPDRRLRVGYISPDFRLHSVAYFFESLLDGHDRQVVEVYGYGNVAKADRTTDRLKTKFDHYRDIYRLDDDAVERMIEQDKIDILVELAGHTTNHRLVVLTGKPAPVQVDYLGLNTTGMQQIDYRLTDELVDPPQSQQFYTEQLVHLSEGFICYRPPDCAPPVAPLPAERKGYITFGSFNDNVKFNPTIFKLWAEVLNANDNSRLLLDFRGGGDKDLAEHYLQQFEQLGITRERVEIGGWKPLVEHLQRYGEVDIMLDTYPFNGATNTCHALWMGVPVISLVGKSYVSRAGLSILTRVGLEFFAASTPQEYVARATALTSKPQALAKIRATVRQRVTFSSLYDAKAFARSVEAAYRKMWHRWCQSCRARV